MRALVPTHWHHAPDHDEVRVQLVGVARNRHVACGAPDDVASSHRRRSAADGPRRGPRASLRRRTRCRHRCAGRDAPRSASSPSGRRSRSTGMAMRSVTACGHATIVALLRAEVGRAQPPSSTVEPLGGADAAAAVPPATPAAMATTQKAAANISAVSRPAGSTQPEPVDHEVEHEGVGDVQRQAHRPGVAQQLDRRRAGEAVGQPCDHGEGDERRAERARRVGQAARRTGPCWSASPPAGSCRPTPTPSPPGRTASRRRRSPATRHHSVDRTRPSTMPAQKNASHGSSGWVPLTPTSKSSARGERDPGLEQPPCGSPVEATVRAPTRRSPRRRARRPRRWRRSSGCAA